jgi:cytochrome c biogenesis protein CcmG/thiol:disulfide interchange protein DsbE
MYRTRLLGVLLVLLGLGLVVRPSLVRAEPPWLGLELQSSPQGGARIVDVYPGSPLASLLKEQKFRLGESVIAFEGQPIAQPSELAAKVRAQKPGQQVTLRLRSVDGKTHEVEAVMLSRPSEAELAQLSMQLEIERQQRLIGQPAPEFVIEQLYGPKLPPATLAGTVSALSSKGTPLVLVFFASWCGPCLREIPHLTELQARRTDLRVLGVSTEESDKIRDITTRFRPGYAVGRDLDHKAYRAYGIASYPTTFLIDGSGIVRAVDHGSLTTVETALEKLPKPVKRAP